MEMKDDDIVRDCIWRVIENPPATVEDVLNLEVGLRQKWGGAEVYVPKKLTAGKLQRMGSSLGTGGSLREAFACAGVSRPTGFRLLSRYRSWFDF
jgi:hypothetical protein